MFPTRVSIVHIAAIGASLVGGGCHDGESFSSLRGRVSGLVTTEVAGEVFAVPDAKIRLTPDAFDGGPEVVTTTDGSFVAFLREKRAVEIEVCAGGDGFLETCSKVSVEPEEGTFVELKLAVTGAALAGRVVDADGVPCRYQSPVFRTAFATRVAAGGKARPADDTGRFVMGGLPSGTVEVTATCAGTTVSATATSDGPLIDLVLDNHAPVIRSLVAMDGSVVARYPQPGASLMALVDTFDPDGDALTIQWLQDDTLHPESSHSLPWTLGAESANNLLTVQVTDGKGGVSVRELWLGTGHGGARIAGAFVDSSGAPLPDVHVAVNGVETTTDANGKIRVIAESDERYAVTAWSPGHAVASRVFDSEIVDFSLVLPDAITVVGDASAGIDYFNPATGVGVRILPDSVLDANGDVVSGPVTLSVLPYAFAEADPAPGNGSGTSIDGSALGIDVVAAVSILLTDPNGNRLSVSDRLPAQVALTPPPDKNPCDAPSRSPPQAANYSESTGVWNVTLASINPGDGSKWRFESNAAGPVAVIAAIADTCISVRADRKSIAVPLELELAKDTGCKDAYDQPIYEHVRDITIGDYDSHAIGGLAVDTIYRLSVSPGTNNGTLYYGGSPLIHYFRSPAEATPFLLYPYATCTERLDLLRRHSSDIHVDHARVAFSPQNDAYYQSIGAYDGRATFSEWRVSNGFGSGDEATARFYNAAELGIGREISCRKDSSHFACYIVKYGEPGGPVAKALDDLAHQENPSDIVAIDVDASGAKVRFYVYSPQGLLKHNTKFVPGQTWTVPGACYGCHWTSGSGEGGVLASVDPNTHIYADMYPRDSQQQAIRRINAMVASMTKVTSKELRQYIDLLYPDGVSTALAMPADPVRPGWQGSAKSEMIYRWVIRSHCQVCHISGIDRAGGPHVSVGDAICGHWSPNSMDVSGYYMPGSWISHRNLWQGNSKAGMLLQLTGSQTSCDLFPRLEVDER
ncbi:MAG: carboxypeptidase-like regulatory domain-containing protein [Polyangiales bacterium]